MIDQQFWKLHMNEDFTIIERLVLFPWQLLNLQFIFKTLILDVNRARMHRLVKSFHPGKHV